MEKSGHGKPLIPRKKYRTPLIPPVQAVRSRYNRGVLTKGIAPKVASVRYDEDGKVVTPRGKK